MAIYTFNHLNYKFVYFYLLLIWVIFLLGLDEISSPLPRKPCVPQTRQVNDKTCTLPINKIFLIQRGWKNLEESSDLIELDVKQVILHMWCP